MSIGMSYTEFWEGQPDLVKAYYKADVYRREQQNNNMWLQGAYIYNAIAVVMANSFSKQGKNAKYIEKPFEIIPKTKTDKEINAEKEKQKVIDYFTRFKKSWDMQHKE